MLRSSSSPAPASKDCRKPEQASGWSSFAAVDTCSRGFRDLCAPAKLRSWPELELSNEEGICLLEPGRLQDEPARGRRSQDFAVRDSLSVRRRSRKGTYRLRTQIGFRGLTRAATRYDEDSWGAQCLVRSGRGRLRQRRQRSRPLAEQFGRYPLRRLSQLHHAWHCDGAGQHRGRGHRRPDAERSEKRMWDERRTESVFVVKSSDGGRSTPRVRRSGSKGRFGSTRKSCWSKPTTTSGTSRRKPPSSIFPGGQVPSPPRLQPEALTVE